MGKEKYPQKYVTTISENVRKISKEDLALWAHARRLQSLSFKKTETGGMIVAFGCTRKSKILNDGTFICHEIIDLLLYAQVEKYRKFLIYSPNRNKILGYTDHLREIKPGDKIFFVDPYEDETKTEIWKKIQERRSNQ